MCLGQCVFIFSLVSRLIDDFIFKLVAEKIYLESLICRPEEQLKRIHVRLIIVHTHLHNLTVWPRDKRNGKILFENVSSQYHLHLI